MTYCFFYLLCGFLTLAWHMPSVANIAPNYARSTNVMGCLGIVLLWPLMLLLTVHYATKPR